MFKPQPRLRFSINEILLKSTGTYTVWTRDFAHADVTRAAPIGGGLLATWRFSGSGWGWRSALLKVGYVRDEDLGAFFRCGFKDQEALVVLHKNNNNNYLKITWQNSKVHMHFTDRQQFFDFFQMRLVFFHHGLRSTTNGVDVITFPLYY